MKIKLTDIAKTFPSKNGTLTALEEINLEISEGEFVCLVGPSGCGKSTLLNIIAGFDRPDEGSLVTNGRPANGARTSCVMIFQEPALFPWLTARKNVEFGLKMAGMPKKERTERALAYLKMVHLSRFVNSNIHELSGGMKQRVALARALALNPDVLLMDEPFAALDAQTRDMLHEELTEIWSKTKKTILFVTHNVREAVHLGDRVLVLSARPGRIKSEFKIDLVRPRDPANPDVGRITSLIMKELKEEVEKIAKEEFDSDWAASKATILHSADHSMGSGI
ncbi:MAG: ABC transporter ATP-binding protein [Actinobacteria bacterium]|nr:ABC transporter ATP-binding protein [Actinomycetota bacterium]